MFERLMLIETVVLPKAPIRTFFSAFYEVVWLWRYTNGNMATQREYFSHASNCFHMTLLKFPLVSVNAINNF